MAKIPGAVTAPSAPRERSLTEQLLISLAGQAPQLAAQYFTQYKPQQAERTRQLGVLEAGDRAGTGELQALLGAAGQPTAEGDALSAYLLGAGLTAKPPAAFAKRTGLGAVPKGLDPTALGQLQETPGAIAALAERGRGVQESALRAESSRVGIAGERQRQGFAAETALRSAEEHAWKANTADFEQQTQPLILEYYELRNAAMRSEQEGNLLDRRLKLAQLDDLDRQVRERALNFVTGLRDRNLGMVAELASRFSNSAQEATGLMSQLAPIFGLDVLTDPSAISDAVADYQLTGQAMPPELRSMLDINPVRLFGSSLGLPTATADEVISHIENGGALSDYWTDTLRRIETEVPEKDLRERQITQLKAFMEAANAYYKLGESFNLPDRPGKWGNIFRTLIFEINGARSQIDPAAVGPSFSAAGVPGVPRLPSGR